jgi:hypothetical protein
MNRTKLMLAAGLVGASLISSGCESPDWENADYVARQLTVGSERAVSSVQRLSIEDQVRVVPALVATYQESMQRDRVLENLIRIAGEATDKAAVAAASRDLLVEVLNGTDDDRAAQAARALSAMQQTDTSVAIAQRLQRTADRRQYPIFMQAIRDMPTTGAADVVAEILVNRAERIGGIETVRQGCRLFGELSSPSEQALRSIAYGLVNLIPARNEDAMQACELAAMQHGDAVVPYLVEMLNSGNEAVLNLMRELNMRDVGAQMRAAVVLARLNTDASAAALRQWLSSPHPAPIEELRLMAVNEQQDWFALTGQLFTFAVQGLGMHGAPEDLALLRRLESLEVPNSALRNFESWFGLSAMAELGLRNAVYDQLSRYGTAEDREMLWTRAASATTGRGGVANAVELRTSILHFLGRTAQGEDLARYEALFNEAPPEMQPSMFVHRVYFLLPSMCNNDVACYAARVESAEELIDGDEYLREFFQEITDQQQRDMQRSLLARTARTGALWQLATRFGDQEAAGAAVIAALSSESLDVREQAAQALFVLRALPADWSNTLGEFLEGERGNNNPRVKEIRHVVEVFRTRRLRRS